MAKFEMYPKGDGIEYNLSTSAPAMEFIRNNYESIKSGFKRIRPIDSTTRHDIEQAYMDGNKLILGLIAAGVKIK